MNYKEDIKAIVFDYDGTLIDFDQNASDYTKLALKELSKKDYKICLSSGRPSYVAIRAFEEVFGEYQFDYVFGCNGNEYYDVKNDNLKIYKPLEIEDIRHIANELDVEYLSLGCYEGDNFLVNHTSNPYIKKWSEERHLNIIQYDFKNDNKQRTKLLVVNDPGDRDKETEYLKSADLANYNCFYSSPYLLEVVPKGISKAITCDILSEILNCDKSAILSFGDGDNDMPMLLNSTGVLMANASDELKKQINLVTGDVHDEGIYKFLKENGLI